VATVGSTGASGWGAEASVGAETGGAESTAGAAGAEQDTTVRVATSPIVKKRKRGFIKISFLNHFDCEFRQHVTSKYDKYCLYCIFII
jgi:hypothetical protein